MTEAQNESDEPIHPLSTPLPTEKPDAAVVSSAEQPASEPLIEPPAKSPAGPSIEISPRPRTQLFYRHTFPVRASHWINVLCLPILIMSGFQIFNAHPALYWGERSDRDRPILSMKPVRMSAARLAMSTAIVINRVIAEITG